MKIDRKGDQTLSFSFIFTTYLNVGSHSDAMYDGYFSDGPAGIIADGNVLGIEISRQNRDQLIHAGLNQFERSFGEVSQ